MALTEKQRLFIDYYLTHFNATRAAKEAGYSHNTARFIAAENLSKPNIREKIDERVKEIISQTDEKRAALIQFWFDIMQDDEASEGGKLRASEDLGKYLAMFIEKHEHSGELQIAYLDKDDAGL
jgi:phage terminase small subunit